MIFLCGIESITYNSVLHISTTFLSFTTTFLSFKMEPYRFRACSPMMQAFKNKYWYSNDIKVVLPPGSIGSKVEIAHCVLVLGCLIDAQERGVYSGSHRDVLLQDVYGAGADKMVLTDDAQRAYHHYKDDKSFALSWIEWLLLSLYYPDALDFDQSRLLARDAAIMALKYRRGAGLV